jgi:hypothetical protein
MDNLNQIRRIISLVVYGSISLIIALIIVRILLMLIGSSTESGFVSFIYSTSDTFVGMFRGIYQNININAGKSVIEIFTLVALIFYISVGYLVSKSIRSVVEVDLLQVISNIIDTGFKFVEFLLITRFLLKLTGASTVSQFVSVVYEISNIIYEPFQGILPGIQVASLGIIFETSTLIAIIAIIIFDIASESMIAYINKTAVPSKPKVHKAPAQHVNTQPIVNVHVPQQQYQPMQYQAPTPNITIQMPPQQPQPQYVDRRTVQVVSPNQPLQPSYPYANQNHLESQRPVHNQQMHGQNYNQPIYNEPMAPRDPNN